MYASMYVILLKLESGFRYQ